MRSAPDHLLQSRTELSRWSNEGGAGPGGRLALEAPDTTAEGKGPMDAEQAQLRMRVIALENVVIALLAAGVGPELGLARGMAGYISPRPGSTPHPLTIHAAAQMLHLVARAGHFRSLLSTA